MTLPRYLISLVFLAISSICIAASTSDLAKEKRWEEQIVPSLMVGDAVKLKANGTEFLALYTENEADHTHGAALVIHGIGIHPAWPDIIEPTRIDLPEHGWHTLSLQMPILPNEAESKDYVPLMEEVPSRIKAGVNFLKAKGINNIVIIAHSLGTVMSAYYLANKPDPTVRAYVAIGMSRFSFDDRYSNVKNLAKIQMPILDIYGSEDLSSVVSSADVRLRAGKQANKPTYTQIKVPGANHFFDNMNDILIKRIRGWLNKHAKGVELKTN